MKRALVLGGGGNVGIAWELAIVGGLLDAGIDLREADLIIGTSAGSVVGTHVGLGRDVRELVQEQRARPPRPLGGGAAPDMTEAVTAFQLWAGFDEMDDDRCAQVGRVALGAKTMPEADWLAGFEQNGWTAWPETPLLITAVDAESGAFAAFDRKSGVGIARAVAASCSVPALFPPVKIGGRRYTDGGVRSGTSADLALRIAPERVLIIAPMGATTRGVSGLAAKQIERETALLEAAGAQVFAIRFDDAAKEASGQNLMDQARAEPTAAAGAAHAQRIGDAVRAWWGGGAA